MSSPSHITFLDQIRGFAILAVFLHHSLGASYGVSSLEWAGWFPSLDVTPSLIALLPLSLGWCGVAIFFVVSGFCIHLSHARSLESDFRAFFVRRFFRIYPAYIVVLLVFSFVYPWARVGTGSLFGWAQFFSHVFLVQNVDPRFYYGINASFWSLAVEMQLYALYPLLLFVARKKGWTTALWMSAILELSIRGFGSFRGFTEEAALTHAFQSPFAFWYSWSIGAVIAERYLKREPLPFAGHSAILWLLLAIASNFFRPLADFSFLLFSLTTGVVLARCLSDRQGFPRIGWLRPLAAHLQFTGVVSYSLYLIHQPLVGLVPKYIAVIFPGAHLQPMALLGLCLLTWPMIVGLAWLLYRSVELTAIGMGKAVTSRIMACQEAA